MEATQVFCKCGKPATRAVVTREEIYTTIMTYEITLSLGEDGNLEDELDRDLLDDEAGDWEEDDIETEYFCDHCGGAV